FLGGVCALLDDGSVWCWGRGNFVAVQAPGIDAIDVSSGDDYACALLRDGSLTCWISLGQATPVVCAASACATESDCSGTQPLCDTFLRHCGQCRTTGEDDCPEACTAALVCGDCGEGAICPDDRPVCASGKCVACEADFECPRTTAPTCLAGACG